MSFGLRRAASCLSLLLLSLCLPATSPAAPPLKVYGNLPGFERAALSPSGDKIALIGVVGETRRLMVVDGDTKLLFNAPLGNQKIRGLGWGGDQNVLLQISATVDLEIGFTADKAELSNVIVIPLNGRKPWELFKGDSGIAGGVRGGYGIIEREGRWFGYFGGMTVERSRTGDTFITNTAPDLYEVDLVTGSTRRVARRFEGDNSYRDWLIDEHGKVAATFEFSSSKGDWKIRDREGDVVASGRAPTGGIGLIGLGRSPGSLLYSFEAQDTGIRKWVEVNGGKTEELLPGEAALSTIIDPRSRRMIGYVKDGDVPADRFFEPRYNKVMDATRRAFPGMSVSLVDWNASFDRLIATTDGPGDPGTWWLVDVKSGKARILGVSYPMKEEEVAPVRVLSYKAADGLEMAGVLTVPPGRPAINLPVVILPHGGPTARDYPTFDWWPQALASRGYAVFQPNFRGSSGYGPEFERAGHGEWGRKMQTDISDGLAELARQGIVDPKRACIMGASYGGYAALAGVTIQQGLYRCAVSVAGVSDVARMVHTETRASGGDPTLRRALKQQVGSGRDLKLVSPVNFAERADAPILLVHGKDDTVVLYDQSNDMAAALRRAGKPVEFLTLKEEDHWLSKGATRLALLEAAIAFVEKHNPANPATD